MPEQEDIIQQKVAPAPIAEPIKERVWFTDGASMVYPKQTRTIYWALNLLLFLILNMFLVRIQSGDWFTGSHLSPTLIETLLSPLNIFQYPEYILVLGTVMALMCTVPILTAQQYNFWHAMPFILVLVVIGHDYHLLLSGCLVVSCAGVSFDPLRFKSKFISSTFWLFPIIVYWIFHSGNNPEEDILKWAVLYSPWTVALFFSVGIFALIIGIGHFNRYKPGTVFPIFSALLITTILFFDNNIGMDERDFRAIVFKNSPSEITVLQSRSIVPDIELQAANERKKQPYLSLEQCRSHARAEWYIEFIGNDIKYKGSYNDIPKKKRRYNDLTQYSIAEETTVQIVHTLINTFKQIDKFISIPNRKPEYLANALYYKGMLKELKVDERALEKDRLHFYYSNTTDASKAIWEKIMVDYADTDVSIEAQYRLAKLQARTFGQDKTNVKNFDTAVTLLKQAQTQCDALLIKRREKPLRNVFGIKSLSAIFTIPQEILNDSDLIALQARIGRLLLLLERNNHPDDTKDGDYLTEFISFDEHKNSYHSNLTMLQKNIPHTHPLADNIAFALAMLETNTDNRIDALWNVIEQYNNQDGAIEAMLERAVLLLSQRDQHGIDALSYLETSREHLQKIKKLKPKSYYSRQAQSLLDANPVIE